MMIRRTAPLAAALFAVPLLAATPAAGAHSRVELHFGLGALLLDPPFHGHIHAGFPAHVRPDRVGLHDHGRRTCRIERRHGHLHRDLHWR